ncbi:hypothetical protein F8M41_001364 [Gigaspora margarita]|uniref:Uncharacterized protein n=1 Tax=Gigaspora margarita TaxID=4874 RepID=A0A8H3XF92_GIGMA|nr:hypothetical protein F8M41_001364 [Gigaspora margarita]
MHRKRKFPFDCLKGWSKTSVIPTVIPTGAPTSSTIKLSRCHEDQTRLTNCPSSKCPALGFILLKSGMFKIERSSRSGNSRIKYDIES